MAWLLSTGLQKALLAMAPTVDHSVIASTISFGDGDGTGGRDTINDSGDGLGGFGVHDFILTVGGDNNNVLTKAISAADGTIEVAAGTFTAAAAGTNVCLIKITSGSLAEVLKNGVLVGRDSTRPSSADLVESGDKVVVFTKGGLAFTAGQSENGINLGAFSGNTVKRAVDPETGETERWLGAALMDGNVRWVAWYDNSYTEGASTTSIRMYGTCNTSGSDAIMTPTTDVTTGLSTEITDVSFEVEGG